MERQLTSLLASSAQLLSNSKMGSASNALNTIQQVYWNFSACLALESPIPSSVRIVLNFTSPIILVLTVLMPPMRSNAHFVRSFTSKEEPVSIVLKPARRIAASVRDSSYKESNASNVN